MIDGDYLVWMVNTMLENIKMNRYNTVTRWLCSYVVVYESNVVNDGVEDD